MLLFFFGEDGGAIALDFLPNGLLENRYIDTNYGHIRERWIEDKKSGEIKYERQYQINKDDGYEKVSEEEYMKNVDDFTLQIIKDTGMIKDISSIVTEYLHPKL